jgi:hypothetical protein
MQLRPRHFLLLALVLAAFLYRIIQSHRAAHRDTMTIVTTPHPTSPGPNTPAWSAFDAAANLRDASPTQFDPALQTLSQQIDAIQPTTAAADLNGCKTWLLFYRQTVLHPSKDPAWHDRSTQHLNSCAANHQDIAS